MNARQRFTDRLPVFGKCLDRKSLTLPLFLLGAVDSRGQKKNPAHPALTVVAIYGIIRGQWDGNRKDLCKPGAVAQP